MQRHFGHSCSVAFGGSPLMVTKFRSGLVSRIVRVDLLLLQNIGFEVETKQFLLECRGGIVGTEDFRCEAFHIGAQMAVHRARL